ncbi:MAG: hypothetical protein JXB62_08225 [Pirellulales bacterium]|nr:hypothetical protein [Pirellulales bacterium]
MVVAIPGVLGLVLTLAIQAVVNTASDYSESSSSLVQRLLAKLEQWDLSFDQMKISEGPKAQLPYTWPRRLSARLPGCGPMER